MNAALKIPQLLSLMLLIGCSSIYAVYSVIRMIIFLSTSETPVFPPLNCTQQDETEKQCWENGLMRCLLIDSGLVLIFILQHSLMASSWFKEFLLGIKMDMISRCLNVSATSFCLTFLTSHWRATDTFLWSVSIENNFFWWLFFTIVQTTAWTLIIASSFLMDIYQLLGIRQVYYHIRGLGDPLDGKSTRLRLLYDNMRHPGLSALMVIMIVHPHMTLSRFLLTLVLSTYSIMRCAVTEADHVYLTSCYYDKQYEMREQQQYTTTTRTTRSRISRFS